MNIRIPEVTKAKPDTGIVKVSGKLFVCYTQDGKRVRVSIGDVSMTKARSLRDDLYGGLLKLGAEVAVRGRPKASDSDRKQRVAMDPKGNDYIRQQPPWVAKIGNRIIATGKTEAEVRRKRNEYFGV